MQNAIDKTDSSANERNDGSCINQSYSVLARLSQINFIL